MYPSAHLTCFCPLLLLLCSGWLLLLATQVDRCPPEPTEQQTSDGDLGGEQEQEELNGHPGQQTIGCKKAVDISHKEL